MQLIVHGGAGGAPDDPEPRQAVLDEAAATGAAAETPLDAVETAVRVLETDEQFNAGVGGARQSDGIVRTDAGVMTGDRAVGAACSMPGVEHAVTVARGVLERTPHILLAGDNAVAFADDIGVDVDVTLTTDRSTERWADLDPPDGSPLEQLEWVSDQFGGGDGAHRPWDHDTVGAVARDGAAFAAATSTGGRWLALAGRVGDVPQVGSGFYAAPAGAASATGAGEDIARVTLCRRAVQQLEAGDDAETAATTAIEEFAATTDATAGIIVIDDDGVGEAYNSEAMQTSTHAR
ncbi:MAG: isoaspartyl peptidase/L-asparaginase [Halobacteriaceae archaeon]